ncbi:microtubule-actin cross-linking factor 1 isoform X33 [Drosophila elegans]|uniref:microtubule-actin cross-linking factor 1 isoform X33 n=1 Tax=Drosophila elegans TaxID=30023 RepID=UPI0007E5BFF8|nr:microtubule-actin cross-linking factor 1 isoform X33 [Drosophila elegans]
MTSHSYYKDRLGFDPNEQQPGSSSSMRRSSSRQTTHHHQSYHHATTSSGQSPARVSVSPGGGGVGLSGKNGSLEYQQVQREQRDRELYSNSNSHHLHQQLHHRHSAGSGSSAPYDTSGPAAPKKAKQSSTQAQPQGGYEDALTQFKGSMSIWDHFIEDWDIMHERDAIQKKTFTKWVNKHLKKHWKYAKTYTMLHVCVTTNGIPCCSQSANRRVVDLFEDLRDGHNLLSLLEVLSGEHLPREKGKMRFHMLQNAQMALDFLRYKKIKLVNIRAEDIVDGNPKLTLGLIWTIILHFQISDIVVGKEDNVSAREALLRWARRSTARYPGVRVNDFTSSWRDGLAFSALVHRNRPDLLDWRKARNDRPRERLETAFHIVEKEYGVTRLLDPEDVDTNEPDEKSLITYISSLYDVFPEPPSIHPLFDMESQRRVHEYRDLAQQFIYWCREKTAYLQERSFPPTLIEMKRLLSDLQRFRSEEVSARKREKSKLIQIYKELERYFETVGEVDVEAELRPDAIEKAWYRMNTALQDREVILQQEIERLERLQRLADKVQREIKHVDQKLTDLETRIGEEGRRIERLHPVDAKSIVEALETEIRHLEEPIQDMNQDCHVLNEGRYPHVSELHKKVNKLHQRWAQLRTNFHTNLVQKLSGLKYPVHETTVTRQTRMVVESRQIDTNPHFRDLQEHIEWCQNKLKQLLAADYGSDLPSVKEELDRQQHEHKIIDQFHTKILNDERQQTKFSGDELALYQQRLNQLQKVYAELLSTSTKRLSDLDSLQHFLGQASSELQWLNEKEQVEITRDWADKQLDLPSVHRYYENLMSELEKREMHFATILDRGEALLNQQHPASKCIEAHLTALQQQWAWLLQLTLCLEVHLKHATEYHQFFGEIKDAEQWLAKRDEILNSKFSQSDFGLDQGESLLRGMQDLREELNAFGETVATLQRRAQTVVPLNKRRQPVNRQGPVQAICAYKQQGQLQIEKGETVTLLDNSGRVKWRVRTAKGQEGPIPGACLLLPPPDQEAIDAAERLKRLFDRSVALWQKKHLRLRQNMIFATIRVVKGWDFDQFLAMGPEQRTAIRRALNDDADKLLSEGDPNDPQLRRLRREMDEVNRLFDEFEKRARAEEESKQASRIFTEECIAIKSKLEDMARELDQIILAPLPRDLDSLEHVLEIHSDYERRLHLLEPELKHLQETFRTIALKTPVLKKSLDNLMELWKELNTQSGLHKDRLKLLEASLAGLEDNEHVISELENELARHQDLPSTAEGLQQVFKKLNHMQDIITQQQPQMDKMNDAADQLGRMGVPTKVLGDLKRLHSNVERLNTRWSAVCNQLGERMRSCETAIGLIKNLQSSVQVEESWVDGTTERLSAMPTATSAYELDKLLGAAIERKPKIENVNVTGGRLIREAKQAVFEKFNMCEENVNDLLRWVTTVEQKISSVGGPREKIDELRNQINALKQIKDEIESQQRPVATCLEQIRQIVLTGGDVLSAPEVTTLENSGRELRSRVDRVNDRTVRLLRRLEAGRDELTKLSSELDVFSDWLQVARRTLEDKERSLSDLTRLSSQADSVREFVSDVIGHQADLRFITMAAQKFVDESKEFLAILNDFRTSLPERLPHVEPLSSAESPIRQEVSLVSAQYKDLLNRVNALQDRVSGLGGRQREYQDALDKANEWLRSVHPRVTRIISEPIAGEPKGVQDQMNEAKALHNELLSSGRLVDNAQQALDNLLRSLGGQLSPMEINQLELPIADLKKNYQQLLDNLGEHCKTLDKTLVQSQGVQDALDSLVGWVNQTEDKYKLNLRPASLIKERLQEQIREHKALLADLQSHQASIDSVQISAKHLLASASNARIAKKVESNLNDVTVKFEKLYEKANKRGEFLDDVYNRLSRYLDEISTVEQRMASLQEALDSRETSLLSTEELARRMNELSRDKDQLAPQFEDCVRNGKDLISLRDVTDTGVLRDRVKALESQWRNINISIDERAKLSKQKAEQQLAYESLKDQVLSWLASTEARVNGLPPVAIDLDRIKQQHDELKPICKDYRDYAPTIDKINEIGAQYDALIRPESPARKRSTYSPIKRASPLRRMSGDARSPSPNKGGILSPLSTGSSGFGSRRSSQDGFQLSELSPVQQQLSEINNRYGLIGVRLNDRQHELDNLNDEVRKQYENLKGLAQFLERVQRQLPKESVSNKDEAERCIKQARKILEDMYEKQSLLDTTKAQVKDILRRKSDVHGAEQLRQENDSIQEKWKNLNDICKNRIAFSEKLRDFLETHGNLKSWLDSKERMLTVLGPISSDPRMVQSQVQQVQVLREEFRTQQPQLKHFQELGHDVVDHLAGTPDAQAVELKLKDILGKWEDLVGKLDDRANSLGGAADSSKEFDAAVNRLREALQNISDNLDALPTDGDHQENLRKIENLERQLEGQRPLLADVEQSAATLCNILGDPASRADVNSRVAALEKQYLALQKKLDTKKAETEASLRDGRHFAENCSKTLGWLGGELSNLTDRLLVSAHKPTLQHQIDTHEPIYREVMAREHEVIMLINKGKDLSDRQQDRGVKRDLDRIQQQWEKLRREAVDRHTRLQTCMEHCKKYSQTSEMFLAWLRTAEDKLTDLTPGVLSKAKLETRLRDLQTFRSEVWKHSGEFENTKGLGETFLTSCDIDKEPIKAELQDIRDRWERLNNDLIARAHEIENCSRRLGDFNDELRNLDHSLGRCEDRLAAHDALGGAAKDPKLLERVKAIREELTNLSKPLQSLKALAKDISAEARAAGGDADHLTNEVDGLADRISELQGRLDDRCGELQSAATAVSQFNEQMKSLGIDLNDLETEIEKLSPPAREIKIVNGQIDDVGKIQNKLGHLLSRLEDAERAADVLVDAGFAADTTQTREQISTLRKTLGRLDNRVRDHEDNLQATLKALREFYDNQSQTLDDIKDVSDEFKRMKPVGSELDQIRRQQEDFRNFRERKVEPLAINVDKVNVAGRDLVRSAASGVSTSAVEKDLEKLNDRWNDLKERMNERDRRLDVALLQSGKFQEALAGLSKWLSDTEEMVANQKPPSSDYKVVKAQLQEQKFLKKMLLDRQNSMGSLANLGKEVANHCEPAERSSIEKQLNNLMKRFDALTDGAEQRELDLEEAMEVAKRFHDKISPLELWLDNTERSVKALELIPTDEEKIQQRIREHDRLHDEILGKKPDFTDLADVAAQLMHLVSDEEAVNLGEKVRGVTERYTGLVDASDNIGALLAESRQGLRHLVLSYQDLVAWMESMEAELKRFKSVPVYAEKLLEQMDHLLELNENIAGHASNVESTVESGAELMKHISNDEAIQLKDKLDSLQRRYGDLTNRGGDLLKSAQNALPLVQQFHEAHNRLVEWMQSAEAALAPSEPRQADVLRLEGELADMRPILDSINQVGPQLCQLSPGEGAATIESIVTRDNRRFDSIVEQIQRKAERLHLSNQRAKEVTGDIDELLEWFREMDTTLREADLPAMEPKLVRAQLQEHRSINDDISSQKGRVRDVTAASKKVLRESPQSENTATLREKLDDLKEIVDTVAQLCSERLGILEQALPLSEHFADSHQGLTAWLDDMEQQISRLSMPALRPDQITLQQDKNERLLQSIAEHKPLLDKLNKTGEALGALVADDDSAKINEILDTDNARYAALRLELRERQQALESALQESSQFSDKLEGMLRALANTVDQVNQLDPLSALPQKIREQIEDNDALMDDLDKRQDAFSAVQRAANDVIAKAGNKSDPAVRDIKAKLEKLNNLWNDVQNATKKRGSSLDDILSVAEPFWKQLNSVMKTLKDLEETLSCQEPPAAQPQDIKKQQVALQEIRHEIDQTKPEVEQVRRHGSNLMNMCGEPDKPEVKKHIEDLDNAWDNITALYAKREENLIDAMEKAMEFHETLQNLLKFLTKAEDKFAHLGAVGSDIDAVKRQIEQLKSFKDEVDPHMVEVEALNRCLKRQAVELTERTSPEQAASIREPLSVVNRRWEALLRGMVERQKQLEHALLHLGQFQHALNELLVWINKTDSTLDQLKPIPGDPQLLEVELAKLKVLANDIQAHQNSVDTLNDAGRQLIETEKGSVEASTTQEKLRKLNNEWKQLLQKASDRQHELEEALREAHGYIAEVQDILGWLGDVDAVIGASKPVGGLPETATEQLERFMEVYNELDENRPKVETIQAQGQEYIKRQNHMKVSSSNLQHTLRTLKQRWDAVVSRASDKKIKLEIALKEATEFHDTLQAFVEWLTQAEKLLSNAEPVSRVLETIQAQMEEHKVLQKDVSTHREAMLLLDKKGTHLKYFSQKQDVILIKNLLVSVQHRWERVVSKAAERTRALDHGYKEAREFNDAWSGIMQYLQETEQVLDQIIEEATASKEPQKIKKYIGKLKETHRQLGAKQSVYDGTMRTGKNLLERAPKGDRPVLDKMLLELKEQWTRVWSKSIDRQRKLEEALLLSGQFSDALGELLEWLKKAKSRLNENGPVHGDLETVQGLCEHHKHIEQDLQKRAAQMQGVLKTGRDLERSGNNPEVGRQLDEMQSIWEEVKSAVAKRGERLQVALVDAEKLNARVQALFDWLDHAEHKLRYAKNAPDDEKVSREMMDIHMDFMKDLRLRESEKTETFEYAEDIIGKAYPDAIPIIKNWLSIIQQRWEEVRQWAINRESKLDQHLQSLKDLDDTIEELLAWLSGLEGTLLNLKHERLPDEIPPVEKLIEDHKEFMENTARRQNEVDRACKPRQLPPGARKPSRSGKTPVRGSSHDLREQSPDGTLRRQSFKGSRDQGLNARKGSSRITPTRDTPDRDRLPHYGPRFSPSSSGPELEFRSPRAKLLWTKWRDVWMLSWERQRLLNDHLLYLKDVERARNFSWDDWRKRFLKYMNHKKSRLTDLFRKMDKDNNGMIPRDVFIDGIINTKFDTSGLEMKAVADLFDRNGEGLIDWQEFIAALRPDWQERKPANDSDKIHDEVKRLVMLCTCRQKFRVFQVGEGKYRFGDSQKLRLVRILRSTVMVRVGGGWVALDEFLQKNDPCRAKGRTNIELREQFILADGVSQSMAAFTPRRSTPNAAATASSSPNAQNGGSSNLPPYMSGQGPIIKVRERSVRSIPMSRPSRSSLSASTPDSLSDNEGSHGGPSGRYTPRKVTYTSTRTGLTPGGSRAGSKPNSRPLSRQGSKPPSRHGSTLSLDSTDDHTPSRIPQRKPSTASTASGTTPRPARLSVTTTATPGSRLNGTSTITRKTASGSASPAPTSNGGMSRSSSIPALTGFGFKPISRPSRIPIKIPSFDSKSTSPSSTTNPTSFGRNISGSSTPSGMQTPRKSSAEPTFSSTMRRTSRGTTPTEKREPFRL